MTSRPMRPKPLIPTYRADRFKFITRANTANEGGGGGGDLDRHVGFGAEVAEELFLTSLCLPRAHELLSTAS